MIEEDLDICMKIIIIGNGAVGKSSMIQRYCKGFFTRNYKKTIGVDYMEKEFELEEDVIRLMLWDTAGQEEFDSITKSYYRGANACVIVFSTVDSNSFEAVPLWNQKVINEVGHVNTVLVLNKMDLIRGALVTEIDGENLAKEMNMKLFKASVKNNENVNDIFTYLAKSHIQSIRYTAQNSLISISQNIQGVGDIDLADDEDDEEENGSDNQIEKKKKKKKKKKKQRKIKISKLPINFDQTNNRLKRQTSHSPFKCF